VDVYEALVDGKNVIVNYLEPSIFKKLVSTLFEFSSAGLLLIICLCRSAKTIKQSYTHYRFLNYIKSAVHGLFQADDLMDELVKELEQGMMERSVKRRRGWDLSEVLNNPGLVLTPNRIEDICYTFQEYHKRVTLDVAVDVYEALVDENGVIVNNLHPHIFKKLVSTLSELSSAGLLLMICLCHSTKTINQSYTHYQCLNYIQLAGHRVIQASDLMEELMKEMGWDGVQCEN
jgi:hypothetical protein